MSEVQTYLNEFKKKVISEAKETSLRKLQLVPYQVLLIRVKRGLKNIRVNF